MSCLLVSAQNGSWNSIVPAHPLQILRSKRLRKLLDNTNARSILPDLPDLNELQTWAQV